MKVRIFKVDRGKTSQASEMAFWSPENRETDPLPNKSLPTI
jgi:hypothetical protein